MILDLSYEKCEYLLFSMKDIIPLPHLFDRHVVYFLIFEERVYFQDNLFKFHFKIAGFRVKKRGSKNLQLRTHDNCISRTSGEKASFRDCLKQSYVIKKTFQVYEKSVPTQNLNSTFNASFFDSWSTKGVDLFGCATAATALKSSKRRKLL